MLPHIFNISRYDLSYHHHHGKSHVTTCHIIIMANLTLRLVISSSRQISRYDLSYHHHHGKSHVTTCHIIVITANLTLQLVISSSSRQISRYDLSYHRHHHHGKMIYKFSFIFVTSTKFCSLFKCTSPCKISRSYTALLLSCKHTRPPYSYCWRKLNAKMGMSRMALHSYQNEKRSTTVCIGYIMCVLPHLDLQTDARSLLIRTTFPWNT
jgi:hypothetical protein